MRGTDGASGSLLNYVDLNAGNPAGNPLRKIRRVVSEALARLDAASYAHCTAFRLPLDRARAADMGEPAANPLFRSLRVPTDGAGELLPAILFWFVGLGVDHPVWLPTISTKKRDRPLTTGMSRKLIIVCEWEQNCHSGHSAVMLRHR